MHLLVEQFRPAGISCSRVNIGCASVSEDSKCETCVYWNIVLEKYRQLISRRYRTVGIVSCITTSWRCSYPVVIDWLVGIENRRDSLSGIDIYVLNFNGIMFNTIRLHECDVMVVDREGKERPTR